jgi:hypothetical protein
MPFIKIYKTIDCIKKVEGYNRVIKKLSLLSFECSMPLIRNHKLFDGSSIMDTYMVTIVLQQLIACH